MNSIFSVFYFCVMYTSTYMFIWHNNNTNFFYQDIFIGRKWIIFDTLVFVIMVFYVKGKK